MPSIPWRLLIDIVGFQSVWWACALGAAAGRWEPGVAAGAVVTAGQLVASGERGRLLATAAASAVLAIAAESLLVAFGLVTYAAAWPAALLAPAWIVTLWIVFATCVPATDRMLGTQHPMVKSAVLGALIAPPTYWAGEGLGALSFAEPRWLALAATGAAWMIAMPLILWVYRRGR